MFLVRLASALLILAASAVQAEELDIIELPAEQPQTVGTLSLNWNCDVLLLTTSQRYRPGSCKNADDDSHQATELPVEPLSPESAKPAPVQRKTRY